MSLFSSRAWASSAVRSCTPGPHRTARPPRLRIDRLEDRVTPAAVNWDGGGDGTSWLDAANWDTNALPTANDDVVLNVAASPTVRVTGNVAAKSVVSNEELVIQSGTAAIGSLQQNGSTFSIETGTLVAPNGIGFTNATVRVNGGTVTGSATASGTTFVFQDGNGQAQFVVVGGGNRLSGTVPAGVTITLLGTGGFGHGVLTISAGTVNKGTLRLDSSNGGLYVVVNVDGGDPFINEGTIEALAGAGNARYWDGSVTNRGLIASRTLADLRFRFATLSHEAGELRAEGRLLVEGGAVVNQSGGTATGPVLLNQVTLTGPGIAGNYAFVGGNTSTNRLGGTISGTGVVTVLGASGYGHGILGIAAGVVNRGVFRFDSNNSSHYGIAVIDASATLTNEGTIEALPGQGQPGYLDGNLLNRGIVRSAAGADFRFRFGTLSHVGGELTAIGRFLVEGGAVVSQSGGTASGPVLLNQATLTGLAIAGNYAFVAGSSSSNRLVGTIAPGAVVTVLGASGYGHGVLGIAAGALNQGTLRFDSNNSSHYAIATVDPGATLTNEGTIEAFPGQGQPNYLDGNLLNRGIVRSAAGADFRYRFGTLSHAGGELAAVGQLQVEGGAVVSQSGGTATGPVLLSQATLTGPGITGNYAFVGGNTSSNRLGGTISGTGVVTVLGASGYGHGVLGIASGTVNRGVFRFDSTNSSTYAIATVDPGATLTNEGTIEAVPGEGQPRYLDGNLLNRGIVRSAAGADFRYRFGTLSHVGGELRAIGRLLVEGGAVVSQSGGTASGPVLLNQVTLTGPAIAGNYAFVAGNTSTNRLGGTIAPGGVVTVLGASGYGHGVLGIAAGVVNRGVLRFDSNNSGTYAIATVDSGATLTNEGTIEAVPGEGQPRYLDGNLLNRGIVRSAAGADFRFRFGTLTHQAGELSAVGRLLVEGGAVINQSGGTANGPVLLYEASLTGPAIAGSYAFVGNTASNRLGGTVAPTGVVSSLGASGFGHGYVAIASGTVNKGALRLDSNNSSCAAFFVVDGGATLSNEGTIESLVGQGNSRYLDGNVVNAGRVNLLAPTELRSGTFTNNGFVRLFGGSLTLQGLTFVNTPGSLIGGSGSFSSSNGTLTNNGLFDLTDPSVIDVVFGPQVIVVTFYEPTGMNAATVRDVANYRLVASGGDNLFGNGNDVDLTPYLAAIAYDDTFKTATLQFGQPLPTDALRLTLRGATILNLGGTPLFATDVDLNVLPDNVIPAVTLDLVAASDSGASSTDDLTNVRAPEFDVTVNKAGRVEIDFDGNGTFDATQTVPAGATVRLTAPAQADGARNVTARFVPIIGSPVTAVVRVTIDTLGPKLLAGGASEQAPLESRSLAFDEPVDPASVSTDDFALTGPGGNVPVTGVASSGTGYAVSFGPQVAPGTYTLTVGPNVLDRAGNPMNQDGDGTNGEAVDDRGTNAFTLAADTTPPAVSGLSPSGAVNVNVPEIRVSFTERMQPATITVADFTVTGPGGPIDLSSATVAAIDARTFALQLPALTLGGAYQVTVGPTALDLAGNPMLVAFTGGFTIDRTGPTVTAMTVLNPPGTAAEALEVTFSEPIRAESFGPGDVTVTDPLGGRPPVRGVQRISDTTFRVTLDPQRRNGTYTVTIGPDVRDTAGNPMDQDGDGTFGEPEDEFSGSFAVSLADLVAEAVSVSPTSPTFGAPATVTWTTKNVGERAAAGSWTEQVYLTQSGVIDASAVLLATVARTGPLAVDGTQVGSAIPTLPLAEELIEGTYTFVVRIDSADAVPEADEANTFAGPPVTVLRPPLPDLAVENVAADVTNARPGQTITLTYTVRDLRPVDAVGPWTERVYLSIDATFDATDRFVADFRRTGTLAGDGSAARSEPIVLPLGGPASAGDLRFVVVADALNEVVEADGTNNAAVAAGAFNVPIILTLVVPPTIAENAGPVRGIVYRTGPTDAPLMVTLASSDTTELRVPATVVIPAGQPGIGFDLTPQVDGALDGDRPVTIAADAAGAESASVPVTIRNTDVGTLTILANAAPLTEGTPRTVTVRRSAVTPDALLVSLVNPRPDVLAGPATITIPSGEAEATFTLTAPADLVPEPDGIAQIVLTAPEYRTATLDVELADDDRPNLTVVLSAATVLESAGNPALTGTVTRDGPTDLALVVRLTSSEPGKLLVPFDVTIPAGAAGAPFAASAVDDDSVDGPVDATVTAAATFPDGSAVGAGAGTAVVTVLDDDSARLIVSLPDKFLVEGKTVRGTVSRNTSDRSQALTVALASSDPAQATVPATVVIPKGKASVTFNVAGVEDAVADGTHVVTVTATADGFNGGADVVTVTDVDIPDLVVSQVTVPATATTGAYIDVGYRIENRGRASTTGTFQYQVFLSTDPVVGGDELLATLAFTGTLKHTGALSRFDGTVPVLVRDRDVGDRWLVVVADTSGSIAEGVEDNNAFVSEAMTVRPAYVATVTAGTTLAAAGTSIPLTGRAFQTDAAGAATTTPAPFVPVNIAIDVRGYRRTILAITDSAGNFTATFRPLPGEAGIYTVAARHPGVAGPFAAQATFSLVAMAIDPAQPLARLVEGTPTTTTIQVTNPGDVPLTGLDVTLVDRPANVTVSWTLGDGSANPSLAGLGALPLAVTLTATDATIPTGTVTLRVRSAGPLAVNLDVPIRVGVEALRPRLTAPAEGLRASVLRGSQLVTELVIRNEGGEDSGPITVLLPELAWLHLATANQDGVIAGIPAGGSATLTFQLTPGPTVLPQPYQGGLVLQGQGFGTAVPIDLRVVTDATGDMTVDVVDEYTFFADGAPHVPGATVTLSDPYTNQVVRTGTSAANGVLAFTAVPEGFYRLRAVAVDHAAFEATVFMSAGRDTPVQAFVSRQTVQYIWTVVPTEIEDETQIVIQAVFETNVPAPVVVASPAQFDVADLTSVGQQKVVELTITNHGLIAADNVNLGFGSHPYYSITPLITHLDRLAAHQSITIPVLMERTAVPPEPASVFRHMESPLVEVPCTIDSKLEYEFKCGVLVIKKVQQLGVTGVEGNCGHPPGLGFWSTIDVTGGGPGVYTVPITSPEPQSYADCDPCRQALFDCFISFIPFPDWYGCINGGAWPGSVEDWIGAGLACLQQAGQEVPYVGQMVTVIKCIKEIKKHCNPDPPAAGVGARHAEHGGGGGSGSSSFGRSADLASLFEAGDWLEDALDPFAYLFNDPVWLTEATGLGFNTWLVRFGAGIDAGSDQGSTISPTEAADLRTGTLPEGVGTTAINAFVARWNRTMAYNAIGIFDTTHLGPTDDPDFVARDVARDHFDHAQDAQASSEAAGFPKIGDAVFHRLQVIAGNYPGQPNLGGVCAKVTVRLDHTAVVTRQAFAATLEVSNTSPGGDPLENMALTLDIRDGQGRDVSDRFVVIAESVPTQADGGQTVRFNYTLIPTAEAAPTNEVLYAVGAVLSYDHDGLRLSMPINPAGIRVSPDPRLRVDYFHQRDVLSDDPHTPEVEPAQPFNLAVLVHNVGAGPALNVAITSSQPTIVENEKGLLVDFQVIGTEVDGQGLTPSLTADLGRIDAGNTAAGRWLLTSTLQGQFIDYSATFEHVSRYGDRVPSLIESVSIHELRKVVRDDRAGADDRYDFLVNEVPDPFDTADTLFTSDGVVESVGLPSAATFDGATDALTHDALPGPLATPADREVQLTATVDAGWTYFNLRDPGPTGYRLAHVRRSDGTVIPTSDLGGVGNAWSTDRTFEETGRPPRLEDRVHFLDFDSTGSYTLVYEPVDTAPPAVVAVERPASPAAAAVSSLVVTLSEPIDPASFTGADLALTLDGGGNLIGPGVTIAQLDDTHYQVNGLGSLNGADGLYVLTVNAVGITDLTGNVGLGSASATWTLAVVSPAVKTIAGIGGAARNDALPFVDVVFTQPVDPTTFSAADVSMTRAGVAVPTDGLAVTQLAPDTFRVAGLGSLTTLDEQYELTVRGSGVVGSNGITGVGAETAAWAVDSVAPAVVSVDGLPAVGSPNAVGEVRITFSEPIDPLAFTLVDLALTRDGVPVDLSGVTLTPLGDIIYRLGGLGAVTATDGVYQLGIDTAHVTDAAGNSLAGPVVRTWTKDSVVPAALAGVQFTPDTGVSTTDRRTSTTSVAVVGTLPEPGLTVEVFDETTNVTLARVPVAGTTFSIPVELPTVGTHRLRVTATDAGGNMAGATLDLFVDAAAPLATVLNVPSRPSATPPTAIDVVFNEPVDATTVTAEAFVLTRGGRAVDLGTAVLTVFSPTTYRFNGPALAAELAKPGAYSLAVKPAVVRDLAGNAAGPASQSWVVVPRADGTVVAGGVTRRKNYVHLYDAAGAPTKQVKTVGSGLRVVRADVTGDGNPDLVVGTGERAAPVVRVIDGQTNKVVRTFKPFRGANKGAWVAAGDVNGDGFMDVVTGPGGKGGTVAVYSGADGSLLKTWQPFGPKFRGGVRVAAGDLDGDGYAEVIAVPASGLGSRYRVLDLRRNLEGPDVLVPTVSAAGGLHVAAGDLDGDGLAELVFGTGGGEAPRVLVYDGRSNTVRSAYTVGPVAPKAVPVSLADADGDGDLDLFVRLGGGGRVEEFDGQTGTLIRGFDLT